jgi:CopG family nickel-responsive transcriptional regulator
MPGVHRITISLEPEVSRALDALTAEVQAANRSRFLSDLLRTRLAERACDGRARQLGTITLLYDHHRRGLADRLLRLQHDSPARVVAATHVHLDHHRCLEVLIVRGLGRDIRLLAEALRQLKGIAQVALGTMPAAPHLRRGGHRPVAHRP